MLQREVIRQALERRRATHGNTPQFQKAQEFFEMALTQPDDCWDDLVREFRRNYADAMDEIVAVLTATDDPLIIFHLLRVADLSAPTEAEAVRKIVRDLDPDKHEVSMLGLTGEPSLRAAIKKKEGLPASVRAALNPDAAAAAEPKEQPKRASKKSTSKKSASEKSAG
ncbi:MAG: hypothetical protein ACJ74W_17485 [Pyrinomonadaceae bacterium]